MTVEVASKREVNPPVFDIESALVEMDERGYCILPNVISAEKSDKQSPMMTDLEQESVLVSEGYAVVPAGPGLGIELDEEAVTRYAVES